VELVAGGRVERTATIRPDLRLETQLAEQHERPACDGTRREIEMEGELSAPPQVRRAGRVEEGRDLGEPVAPTAGRYGGELRARVLRERGVTQSRTPSSASSRRFVRTPAEP
jgi:hypothetical protein